MYEKKFSSAWLSFCYLTHYQKFRDFKINRLYHMVLWWLILAYTHLDIWIEVSASGHSVIESQGLFWQVSGLVEEVVYVNTISRRHILDEILSPHLILEKKKARCILKWYLNNIMFGGYSQLNMALMGMNTLALFLVTLSGSLNTVLRCWWLGDSSVMSSLLGYWCRSRTHCYFSGPLIS